MKNRRTTFIALVTVVTFLSIQSMSAQTGVRIAATSGTADNSAMLDVFSTSKGVLIPRMTAANRTGITTPAQGLLVFQTDAPIGFYYFDGSIWVQLSAGALSGSGTANFVAKWSSANALTNSVIQDNGTNVGVGTAPTSNKLEVSGTANVTSNLTVGGTETVTGLTTLNGGLKTSGIVSITPLYGSSPQIMANTGNTTGGGIMISDDGGFFDYNDGPVTFNGSTGLVIAGTTGQGSSGNWLRINQLGGGGNRDVYVDNNGQLKASEKVATVVDRTERTQDNANSGFRTVGNATNALTVETGDIIVVSVSFQFKWNGGSGTDQPRFGIFGTGASTCGNISQVDNNEWQNGDNVAREYFPISKQYVFTAGCSGTYTFQLYVDNNSNADDASNTSDIVIVATKY